MVARAMKDALAEKWAHLTIASTSPGHVALFNQDSGPTTGHQVISVDGSHAEVILVGNVAFIRGDATAVSSFFGLPAADGPRLANKWISLVTTDSGYATVIDAVTLASALSESTLEGPFTTGGATVIAGVRVIAFGGQIAQADAGAAATGTLYLSTGPNPLPVELDETGADGSKGTVTFGAWGVAVPLSAPSGAIPMSSLVPELTT
jgi:hypothetical protein